MLEKFKNFPTIAKVVIALQLIGSLIGIISLFRLLSMTNQLAFLYQLAGEHVPSKFSIYLSIIVTIALVGSIYLLVSTPNKQSVTIYFGIIILNFIFGIIIGGFGFSTILSLVLPGLMAYTVNENKDFFGL